MGKGLFAAALLLGTTTGAYGGYQTLERERAESHVEVVTNPTPRAVDDATGILYGGVAGLLGTIVVVEAAGVLQDNFRNRGE